MGPTESQSPLVGRARPRDRLPRMEPEAEKSAEITADAHDANFVRAELASRVRLRFSERGWLLRTFTVTGPAFAVDAAVAEINSELDRRSLDSAW